MSSIEPIVSTYSFAASAKSATDSVDLATLDAAFATIASKINEVITVLNAVIRDDDALADNSVTSDVLSIDAKEEMSSLAQQAVAQ